MTRERALEIVEGLITTGIPVHPRIKKQLEEIIGKLTSDEEERLNQLAGSRDARDQQRQKSQEQWYRGLQ